METIVNKELKRFNRLENEIHSAYHDAAFRLGVSDSALNVLYNISLEGECFVSDLWAGGISKQTINSALRKLESEGALYLETAGKKKRVRLTDKGKELASETAEKIIRIEKEILSGWEQVEVTEYLDYMERYLKNLKDKIAEL